MSKHEFTPETRETLRQYVINNRETYEAITAQARQLAGIVRETAVSSSNSIILVGLDMIIFVCIFFLIFLLYFFPRFTTR